MGILVDLLILCFIGGLLFWLATLLPAPFQRIAIVILIVMGIVILVGMLGVIPSYRIHPWRR